MSNTPAFDPNHEKRRSAMRRTAIGLLICGIPCAIVGIVVFISVFFGSSEHAVRNGAIGAALALFGIIDSIIGILVLAFAYGSRAVRYQADEIIGTAKHVAGGAVPLVSSVVREVRQAIRPQAATQTAPPPPKVKHSCGALNDPAAKFCGGCGQPLAANLCPGCGFPANPGARFCDKCGASLAAS